MVGPIDIDVWRWIYEQDDLMRTPNRPSWRWEIPGPGQVLAGPLQCTRGGLLCFQIAPPDVSS